MSDEERPIEPLETWLSAKPYWEQLVWTLCSQGELTDEQIALCYAHLCKELGLTDESASPEVSPISFANIYAAPAASAEKKPKVRLTEIKGIRGVNALSQDCAVSCHPQLTLVYGRNGSGKSGIARLLANACFSRGSREVLPDLRTKQPADEKASAEFMIHRYGDDDPSAVPYSLGENLPVLKQFSVFDGQSVRIHLDEPNKVSFVPAFIAIFDMVASAINRIEKRLIEEKRALRRSNPFIPLFTDPNETSDVSEFCKGLKADSSEQDLLSKIEISAEAELRIGELESDIQNKRSADIPGKSAQLANEEAVLDATSRVLQPCLDFVTEAKASAINELVAKLREQRSLVATLGVGSFDDGLLASVGSPEWKAMLKSAKTLYEAEVKARDGVHPAHCLLCRQELQEQQKALFRKYWDFLEGEAQAELERLEGLAASTRSELQTAKSKVPSLSSDDSGARVLDAHEPAKLADLRKKVTALDGLLDAWIGCVGKETAVTVAESPAIEIDWVSSLARAKERERLALADPTQDIAELSRQLITLKHRKAASALKNEAVEYLRYLKWLAKVERISFPGLKAANTRKRTDAFLVGVVTQYKTQFNTELAGLGCDYNLVLMASGDQGSTVKEYRLEFSADHTPTQVLSEGEQNVCSLADFITEVSLDENNCGIILDDPVSSLDHERKEKIAARLVEEARRRQVMIFTHDLAFMRKLVDAASSTGVEFACHWVRTVNGTPGVVKENSSPKLAVAAKLRTDAAAAVADYAALDPKRQEEAVGVALDYLRAACEALVEEYLFAKTIQRHDDHVRIQNLEEAIFDQSLAMHVIELHGKISEHLLAHNRSDELREDGLGTTQFETMRAAYDTLEGALKAAQRDARRSRDTRTRDGKVASKGW